MTQVASYFAEVGVGIDKKSMARVNDFLDKIEYRLSSFSRRTNARNGGFTFFNASNLQSQLTRASKNLTLRINDVVISRGAINNALRANPLILRAVLSQASLNAIQAQVNSITGRINVRPGRTPTRAPTVSAGAPTGGSGRGGRGPTSHTTQNPNGGRNFNPWHNPMMIGGGVGAFMRYGAYSLPFVAGAYGLNAMAEQASMLQGQQMMLNASVGDRALGTQQMNYLSNLGDTLGRKTSSMTPFFAQMYAGSRGTELEAQLPRGFESFMMYGSVLGLSDEQMKGANRAISQMIAKRRVQAEELRGQLAEHGMPMAVQYMADAVAGGDLAKLDKMMQKGEVDPIKALPKFFDALRNQAEPFMNDFYKSLVRAQGLAAKKTEDWFKRFMDGGALSALTSFFNTWSQIVGDSIPFADRLGSAFKAMVHYFNAMILVPGEIVDWFNGGTNNFVNALFGDVSNSNFATSVKNLIAEIANTFKAQMSQMGNAVEALKTILIGLGNILTPVINTIANIVSLLNAYDKGGASMAMWQYRTNENKSKAKQMAIDMVKFGSPQDLENAERMAFDELQSSNPMPVANTSYNPGQWGSNAATWLSGVDSRVQGMPGGRMNPLNWIQGYTGLGNRPEPIPANTPSSYMNGPNTSSIIYIKQDPLQINAVVEARTDADVMKTVTEEHLKDVYNRVLTQNPIVTQ